MDINQDRLWSSLAELGDVGAYDDERTALRGVNRTALTDADRDGRQLVCEWLRDAGLEVRIDQIGNVFGRRRGTDAGAAAVLLGSHIDSVATAGRFDGCLGVLGALEIVRSLNDAGTTTRRPIDVAFFTEEEGVRFGTDMLGSAVRAGRIELEAALSQRDQSGLSVADELQRIGFAGEHPVRDEPPYAYLECHIEQGPVLAAAGVDLGVVTGVQAISWREVTILGRSAHAGTTPMDMRADAGLTAARLQLALHDLVENDLSGELRVTVGKLQAFPGLTNIVPNRCVCTLDVRHPDEDRLRLVEQQVDAIIADLGEQLGIEITARQMVRTHPVAFDARLQAMLAAEMDRQGFSWQHLLSGAGHDAQEIAAIAPSAMVFVPGLYDGISHNPREFSTPEACAAGIAVLGSTALALADE